LRRNRIAQQHKEQQRTNSPAMVRRNRREEAVSTTRTTSSPSFSTPTRKPMTKLEESSPAPRAVTPTSGGAAAAPSWEDYDEGIFGAANKRKILASSDRSVTSEPAGRSPALTMRAIPADDESPMDELMHRKPTNSMVGQLPHTPIRGSSQSVTLNSSSMVGQPPNTPIRGSSQSVTLNSSSQNQNHRPPMIPVAVDAADRGGGVPPQSPSNQNHNHNDDDVSSLGGVEDTQETQGGWSRIVSALRQGSKGNHNSTTSRPSNLSLEERLLWDTIQKAQMTIRQQEGQKRKSLERLLQQASQSHTDLELRLEHAFQQNDSSQKAEAFQEQLKEMQFQHETEVRAIQRVLADVTVERTEESEELEKTIEQLTSQLEALQQRKSDGSSSTVTTAATGNSNVSQGELQALKDQAKKANRLEQELKELDKTVRETAASGPAKAKEARDLDRKTRRLVHLERDHKIAKTHLMKVEDEKGTLGKQVATLMKQLDKAQKEAEVAKSALQNKEKLLKEKDKEVIAFKRRAAHRSPPRSDANAPSTVNDAVVSSKEMESLQKDLSETCSSLENAKKIIASLENANGSLALESRAKVKAKEEELTNVQKESVDRKRCLDSLATELRDLQKKQGDVELMEKQNRFQIVRQKALVHQLEKNISGLQSAAVVHEVSSASGMPDGTNINYVAEILGDSLIALRSTVEVAERFVDDYDDNSVVGGDCSSEVGRHIDLIIRDDREAAAKELRQELDQKKIAVRRLEDALRKQSEELKHMRAQHESRGRGKEDTVKMNEEIKSLRKQCTTNMEVLAKKERELSVLRSSLKVDDDDVGYISDDGSEGDDETDTVTSSARLDGYGTAQTEALATLLSSGGMDMPGRAQEVEALRLEMTKSLAERERATKELKEERESLTNAKMIISSLEMANKSMMEDLRSRLQDSNTAIASLLDKSMEHEKKTTELRGELDSVKKERDEGKDNFEAEVKKLEDAKLILSQQIDAKDRSLAALKKLSGATVEEKKEEMDVEV
jgi:chromosome segregation ATPase